jgi:oligopeptide/dipeptide ABC transporter ATP-binding protein
MCDKLAVMYAGKIVEAGTVRELFNAPQHPYTKALIGSMPKLGSKAKLLAIPGQPPDLATLPTGCAFHPRCPEALPPCVTDEPGEVRIGASWTARCWRAEAQTPPPPATEAQEGGPPKEIPRDMHAAAVGN